ncbi:Exopolyphosphatase [Bienertia sinuspersici]
MRFAMRFNGNDRLRSGAQCFAIAKDIFEGLRKYNKNVADQLTVAMPFDESYLDYLQVACMLHNIGLYFGKKGYHKKSYSIIMEHSQLDGYISEEIELIAKLVRHHRKKFPRFERTFLQGFSREKFGIICSILRISFIIQKHKLLKLRETKYCDSTGSFRLALENKGEQPMLLDSENSLVKDIEAKIGKEADCFETVLHQKRGNTEVDVVLGHVRYEWTASYDSWDAAAVTKIDQPMHSQDSLKEKNPNTCDMADFVETGWVAIHGSKPWSKKFNCMQAKVEKDRIQLRVDNWQLLELSFVRIEGGFEFRIQSFVRLRGNYEQNVRFFNNEEGKYYPRGSRDLEREREKGKENLDVHLDEESGSGVERNNASEQDNKVDRGLVL